MSEDTQAATPAAAESVTMTDGRVVEFAGKRKLLKETLIDETSNSVSVRLDFRNGQTRTFTIPQSLVLRFAGHGAEQKYGDATAGDTDIDDMILEVEELDERIQKGEWSARREGSGMQGTSVLLQALVEKTGKTVEEVRTFLKARTQKEKIALRSMDGVREIVERIESQKAAKASNIDAGALLAQI